MKKLYLLLTLALCAPASLTLAQEPAQPADTSAASAPATDTVAHCDTAAARITVISQPDDSTVVARSTLMASAIALLFSIIALAMAFGAKRRSKAENNKLRHELQSLKKDLDASKTEFLDALHAQRQHSGATPPKITQRQNTVKKPTPTIAKAEQATEKQPLFAPRQYYLPKADANGVFSKATTVFENGNTIFALTTTDGKNGTFTVVDSKEMQRLALMMPTENLTTACTGENIQTSAGFSSIVTDQPGAAVFAGGHWRIKTKAVIHYEA